MVCIVPACQRDVSFGIHSKLFGTQLHCGCICCLEDMTYRTEKSLTYGNEKPVTYGNEKPITHGTEKPTEGLHPYACMNTGLLGPNAGP